MSTNKDGAPAMSIGSKIIAEISFQGMIRVGAPDPDVNHVFVWNVNAAEQLDALVEDFIAKRLAATKGVSP